MTSDHSTSLMFKLSHGHSIGCYDSCILLYDSHRSNISSSLVKQLVYFVLDTSAAAACHFSFSYLQLFSVFASASNIFVNLNVHSYYFFNYVGETRRIRVCLLFRVHVSGDYESEAALHDSRVVQRSLSRVINMLDDPSSLSAC